MTSNATPDVVRAAIAEVVWFSERDSSTGGVPVQLPPDMAKRVDAIYDRLAQIGAVPAAVESLMYAALGRLGANGLCIVAIADAIETADTINSEGIGSPAATRIRKCAEAARLAYAPVPDLPITADHVPTKAELRAAVEAFDKAMYQWTREGGPHPASQKRSLNALIDRLPIPGGADDGDLQQDVAVDKTG